MPRRRRNQAGFTVLEMLVTLTLLLVVTLLAARLLQDALMQINWSGRKAVETSPNLALDQIRTDLRASSGIVTVLTPWQDAPFYVSGTPTGQSIFYYIEEGRLMRRTIDPGVTEVAERMLMDRVVNVRYRAVGGTIEVEMEFLRMKPPLRRDTAAGMHEPLAPDHHFMSIVVRPRRVATEVF